MSKVKITQEQIDGCDSLVCQEFECLDSPAAKLSFFYGYMEQGVFASQDEALRGFFIIIHALRSCRAHFLKKPLELEKLHILAEKLLGIAQIQPVTSLNSNLYSVLYQALATYRLQRGEIWESIADQMIGEYLGRDSKALQENSHNLEFYARQSWQLGHLRRARTAILFMDLKQIHSKYRENQILLIRICRLAGDTVEAQHLIEKLGKEFKPDDPLHARLSFQKSLIDVVTDGDTRSLLATLNAYGKGLPVRDRDTAKLWLYASRQKESGLASSKKRKSSPGEEDESGQDASLDKFLASLNQIHNLELSFERRLRLLGEVLPTIRHCPDPEYSLVFIAAVIRWLIRVKQFSFASAIVEEYHKLSFGYTEGKSSDVFNLLGDMSLGLPIVSDPDMVGGEFGKISSGVLPRFFKIARVFCKSGIHLLGAHMRMLSPDEFKERRLIIEKDFLREMELTMGQIKGPLMKLGQLIVSAGAVPEETREMMQGVMDRAPPLPLEAFDYAFEATTGRSKEAIFSQLSHRPIAVASIGQVHRGLLKDGTEVAVKVMYPEVESIIESDLKMMKMIKPILKPYIKEDMIQIIFEDLRERFIKECDYRHEAEIHSLVCEAFRGDPYIAVPKVYHEYSAKHVLVADYIRGERLDHFVQTATLEDRNRIVRIMLRFFVTVGIKQGIIQLDPNLSNFIVSGQQLFMIDFGAVRQVPESVIAWHLRVYVSAYQNNVEESYKALAECVEFHPNDLSLERFAKDFSNTIMPAFQEDAVRPFYKKGERNIVEGLMHAGFQVNFRNKSRSIQTDMAHGLYTDVLDRIGAEINWHRELRSILVDLGIDVDGFFQQRLVS